MKWFYIKCVMYRNKDAALICIFMLAVFSYIMSFGPRYSDLPAHAGFVKQMLDEGRLFDNNFLMYFMVNLLTCFTGKMFLIRWVLVLMIASANTAKYILVRNEFARFFEIGRAKMASSALLFVYIVPIVFVLKNLGYLTDYDLWGWYLGGFFVPNVWHNSTVLCMMPFAIVVFFLSIRQFDGYDKKRNRLIALFIVLGVLVKPSFFFIYAVAYPICMFIRYRFRKEFFCSLLPVLLGCLCVLYEFVTIYNVEGDGVAVSVMPLFTLDFWKDHVLCFAVSLWFPALFCLVFWKDIHREMEFWFVLIMLVMAVGISWCCHETGDRMMHGNFGWQVIAGMWFVYYYMLKVLMKHRNAKEMDNTDRKIIKIKAFMLIYRIQVDMGLLYLGKYLITSGYE